VVVEAAAAAAAAAAVVVVSYSVLPYNSFLTLDKLQSIGWFIIT
jgi:hypothetical protein